MEKRKTPVMKSVSTSEAKKNNRSAQNIKTRSSAEFQAKLTVTGGFQPLKRRGVYVKKKTIKIPINGNQDGTKIHTNKSTSRARAESPKVLAHRNRRPDKTLFLASVLQLLSKSTAGTQCSRTNSDEQLKIEKIKRKIKKKRDEEDDDVHFDSPVRSPTARRRSRNWKSKGLNNHVDDEIDSLIVLQSTKQIIQTPSNHSECNLPLNKKAFSTHGELKKMDWTAPCPPSDSQDLNTTPAKASHSKSWLSSNEVETAVNRNENNVYNFFVDVLKTTLSACNVKHDSDGRLLYTNNSSNVSLEMDEVVANKLKIQEIKDDSMAIMEKYEPKFPYNELDMPPCNSKCYYSIMPYENEWGENFKPEYSKKYKVELRKKRNKQRIMSSSFQNRAKTSSAGNRSVLNKLMYKTSSMLAPPCKKKPINSKENKKREFIHSIKQDLQFDKEQVYEKPNFFQALKTMAKNKKSQSVNFSINGRPSDDNVCQLKSRKVFSNKSSLRRQHRNPERLRTNTRQPNDSCYNRQASITIYETSSDESIHSNFSLEVIGYEGHSELSSPSINVSD